jgi:sugar lactone lactonase YvrE
MEEVIVVLSMVAAAVASAAALLIVPVQLAAQRADSAGAARAAMREASGFAARNDTAAALAALIRATVTWPRQGAYFLTLGRFAARNGHPAVARDALATATRMGFGWSLTDPAFGDSAVRALLIPLDTDVNRLREPLLRGVVAYVHPDSLLHPEGVAVEPRTGRIFISSVRQGKIVVVDRGGGARDFATGLDAAFGIVVDTARSILWGATSASSEWERYSPADSGRAAIVALDLASGALRGRWGLPSTSAHLLGDLALAPDGTVWSTDSRTGTIWRADPSDSGGRAVLVPLASADLVSPQGLAFRSDGKVAWIADWTTGLHRIDVERSTVTAVAGDPVLFALGIDGLYRESDRTLIAVQNGIAPTRVVRLHLNATGTTLERLEVLERAVTSRGEPTLGALLGNDFYYIANSPWDAYGADGRLREGAVPERGVVRRVTLR